MAKPVGAKAGEELPFEKALARLEEIVAALEGPDTDLEKAIGLFAEGKKLGAFCEKKLGEFERRIEFVREGKGGALELTPGPVDGVEVPDLPRTQARE